MSGPVFLLDANVFIEASRRYYAFDLAPKFWVSLVEHAGNGQVCSIDRIHQELKRGKDELAAWASGHFIHAFASTDQPDVIQCFGEIMSWVQTQPQFLDAAKADFAGGADGWLIAYGKAKGCVVVTHEVAAPDARSKIKIPNVCQAFSVPFVNTFEMLQRLGVRFG